MEFNSFKTKYYYNKIKKWYLIDAYNNILGRIISKIINIITGKNKPYFTPNNNCGDNVIIININKIKTIHLKNKKYIRYTGYPVGKKIRKFIY